VEWDGGLVFENVVNDPLDGIHRVFNQIA